MLITTAVSEGVASMQVAGELDLAVADEFREAGLAALTPAVGSLVIDLHGVTFMDSTALGALIAIRNAAGEHHAVMVQNAQPNVQRIFEITGLADIFESHEPKAI
jgi:anti-sigma B factor antagonist